VGNSLNHRKEILRKLIKQLFLFISRSGFHNVISFGQGRYCEEVVLERQRDIFNSCGIGTGKSEAEARSKSFKNALK
tara:strand:- start:236 stop:466 length:231 start_codon:yes stop_codon:yes gene_type:complete